MSELVNGGTVYRVICNLCRISPHFQNKSNSINFTASLCYDLDKIEYESGAELAAKVNLAVCARQYLQNAGMSDFDYGQLLSALSKKTK